MSENLPLLPDKRTVMCADVRPVLREVFRDEECLPPIITSIPKDLQDEFPGRREWLHALASHTGDLYQDEVLLKEKYAARIARVPLPNIYKLYPPQLNHQKDPGMILRRDLKPDIEHNPSGDASLWIKNTLNRSSGNLTATEEQSGVHSNTRLQLSPERVSDQSFSFGESRPYQPQAPTNLALPPPLPVTIVCLPPQLDFVNFTVGQLHTQFIRLINVSNTEVRLSIKPPERRELDVELCSRLVVTSGAAAEIKIHYRPVDVRELRDQLLIRVSIGKGIRVPIACYMQPPILEVAIPNMASEQSDSIRATVGDDLLDLGSKLLGDIHRSPVLFYCAESHASFFLLPEDAWLNYSVEIADPSLKDKKFICGAASDCFWVTPMRWTGGGVTQGLVVCRAQLPGLHVTALRILSSTAIVRKLNFIADSLLFSPKHIRLEAHEKDYDICSEDDPACEYYIHLGTAFPGRALSGTALIVNDSPLIYYYYWSVRPWGVCSCWTASETTLYGEDDMCDAAKLARDLGLKVCLESRRCKLIQVYTAGDVEENTSEGGENPNNSDAKAVCVESAQGRLLPRSTTQLVVQVPNVGATGIHRAVLMLILKEIPTECFPTSYDPMIVKTEMRQESAIPGVSSNWTREVSEIVCGQMEVWWEVVPVRFVIDPPVINLTHSRRVKATNIDLKLIQLYGVTGIKTQLKTPTVTRPLSLVPGECIGTRADLVLPSLPNEYPQNDVIELSSENNEWKASSEISRSCCTRHPGLRPVIKWLGLVPPGAKVETKLTVYNDTHQHICWWATCHRWLRERTVSRACVSRPPCVHCRDRTCSCAMLHPSRGALHHGQQVGLRYSVVAPDCDGVVATLVQVHRTLGDVCQVHTAAGTEARATLLVYRVLAPVVTLSVSACLGDKKGQCKVCSLDTVSSNHTTVLRPSMALTVGFRSCYIITLKNLTPIPTSVKWQPSLEKEDILKTTFMPNDCELNGYASVDIQVVLEAMRVSSRRLFVYSAAVTHSYLPIYLLIDAANKGLEVTLDIPFGNKLVSDTTITIQLIQKEEVEPQPKLTSDEIFKMEDEKRQVQKDNICHCRYKMVYIPPVKEVKPPNAEEEPSVEIITEPPPFTHVCPCTTNTKPVLPDITEPYCLQYKQVPLKTVRSRTIVIRNKSSLSAKLSTAVRKWPRIHNRTLNTDKWAGDVKDPGVIIQCELSRPTLEPCGEVDVVVRVYADCWGLYYDQIMLQIEHLEPIVIDVWIEVVGAPLRLVSKSDNYEMKEPPILWMTQSDPLRSILISNPSRASLCLHTYVVTEKDQPQDELPFRLYLRFYDVLPPTCPCVTAYDSDSYRDSSDTTSIVEEMETCVEIYLGPDCGKQDNSYYKVEPSELTLESNVSTSLKISLLSSQVYLPPAGIIFRAVPINRAGAGWYRPDLPAQLLNIVQVNRLPKLQISCSKLFIELSALDLPENDIIRVRKKLHVQNTGSGYLKTQLVTEQPWCLVVPQQLCFQMCLDRGPSSDFMELNLPPMSSAEISVEVTVVTNEAWPQAGQAYQSRRSSSSNLRLFDEYKVLLISIPLTLHIEYPIIRTIPSTIDFGFVMDGDTRKTYFTVMHSGSSDIIEVSVQFSGDEEFRHWPRRLVLTPRCRRRVYVQYSAKWKRSPAEGVVRVQATSGAGAWCAATVSLHVQPALDRATHLPVHDYTDDSKLLPQL